MEPVLQSGKYFHIDMTEEKSGKGTPLYMGLFCFFQSHYRRSCDRIKSKFSNTKSKNPFMPSIKYRIG
jgi:hypothetical protein